VFQFVQVCEGDVLCCSDSTFGAVEASTSARYDMADIVISRAPSNDYTPMTRTLGPHGAILTVEVLAQALHEREQLQFAILESRCAGHSHGASILLTPVILQQVLLDV
jgi:hypothetical protein